MICLLKLCTRYHAHERIDSDFSVLSHLSLLNKDVTTRGVSQLQNSTSCEVPPKVRYAARLVARLTRATLKFRGGEAGHGRDAP